jgi:hypothetical protein
MCLIYTCCCPVAAVYLVAPNDQNRVFSAGLGKTSAVALRARSPESASAHGGSLIEESGS